MSRSWRIRSNGIDKTAGGTLSRSSSPRSCARLKMSWDHIGRSPSSLARTSAGLRPVLASRPVKAAVTTAVNEDPRVVDAAEQREHVAAQAPGVRDLHGVRPAVVGRSRRSRGRPCAASAGTAPRPRSWRGPRRTPWSAGEIRPRPARPRRPRAALLRAPRRAAAAGALLISSRLPSRITNHSNKRCLHSLFRLSTLDKRLNSSLICEGWPWRQRHRDQDRIDPEVPQEGADPCRRLPCGHLRHDHRQRGAAHPRPRSLHASVADHPVGDDRLPARARHRGAALYVGAAALRRQAAVAGRAHGLPHRLNRFQPGVERRLAHRLAGGAGRRRRHHVPAADHP